MSRSGLFLGLIVFSGIAWAQAVPDTVESLQKRLQAEQHFLRDWAGLNKYGSEDTEVHPPKPGEQRVVFIGDDITAKWGEGAAKFFPGKPYFNRGISEQISPQMLVRFRQDVVSLQPKVVVIEAGTNDFATIIAPGSEGTIEDALSSMIDIAKENGIRVVLASILPVCDCFGQQTRRRPPGKIIAINGTLKRLAQKTGSVYLNYYAALVDGREMKKEYSADGFLPNAAGYAVMAPLAEQAIQQAIQSAQQVPAPR